jgi:hypothetical protein
MGNGVPNNNENMKMCACPECPSYKNSPLSGALFCSRGKSEEDVLESGCMCSFCPVAAEYGLKLEYYCVRGKSADIP